MDRRSAPAWVPEAQFHSGPGPARAAGTPPAPEVPNRRAGAGGQSHPSGSRRDPHPARAAGRNVLGVSGTRSVPTLTDAGQGSSAADSPAAGDPDPRREPPRGGPMDRHGDSGEEGPTIAALRSPAALAKWMGLALGNPEGPGQRLSRRTIASHRRLRATLVGAAQSPTNRRPWRPPTALLTTARGSAPRQCRLRGRHRRDGGRFYASGPSEHVSGPRPEVERACGKAAIRPDPGGPTPPADRGGPVRLGGGTSTAYIPGHPIRASAAPSGQEAGDDAGSCGYSSARGIRSRSRIPAPQRGPAPQEKVSEPSGLFPSHHPIAPTGFSRQSSAQAV